MTEIPKTVPEKTQVTETNEQKVLDAFASLKAKLDQNDPIPRESRGNDGIMEMKNGQGRWVAFIDARSIINKGSLDTIVSGSEASKDLPRTEISIMKEVGKDGKIAFHLKTTIGDKTETTKNLSPEEAMKILQKIDSRIDETIQIYKEYRNKKINEAENLSKANEATPEDPLKQLV